MQSKTFYQIETCILLFTTVMCDVYQTPQLNISTLKNKSSLITNQPCTYRINQQNQYKTTTVATFIAHRISYSTVSHKQQQHQQNLHHSNMSSNNSASDAPRLGPTWRSNNQGRGFQPPPAAVPTSADSHSSGGSLTPSNGNANSFSLLDMDDDGTSIGLTKKKVENGSSSSAASSMKRSQNLGLGSGGSSGTSSSTQSGRFMSRSEGLRSSGAGSGGFSTRASKLKGNGSGRSLADLASRFTSGSTPSSTGRSHSHRGSLGTGGSGGNTRDGLGGSGGLVSGGNMGTMASGSAGGAGVGVDNSSSLAELMELEKNTVRYTRERLLSMRPRPTDDDDAMESLPLTLTDLEGTSLFSREPFDPVCWDNFDANEIWSHASRNHSSRGITKQGSTGGIGGIGGISSIGGIGSIGGTGGTTAVVGRGDRKDVMDGHHERRGSINNDGGAWRRGVALPPAGEGASRRSGHRYDDAENPDDLWDDPSNTHQNGAAADFSAFGGNLDDDPLKVESEFDLGHMSEAARKFEEDFRQGSTTSSNSSHKPSSSDLTVDSDGGIHNHNVNPRRPLASEGTTIRSGSGDNVSVFEDFGEPEAKISITKDNTDESRNSIKSGDEQTASSRLMQMIGVTNDTNAMKEDTNAKGDDTQNVDATATDTATDTDADTATTENINVNTEPATTSLFSFSSGVSKNPWGDPVPAVSTTPQESYGLDLAAKLRESSIDQQLGMQSETERMKREEMERMRLMEAEEEKRRATLLAQQQAELVLRQRQAAAREQQQKQAQQQQQQQQGTSQIELILIDRISTILENTWGRSDLMSVLSTLHNEDSRLVPMLRTVDILRALIARYPRRFALVKDPAFGAEMAVLLMNNTVWQQQRQAEELELRRQQEEHQKMLAAREAARIEAEARAKNPPTEQITITDSPWYYADPQGNVQGPFRGEEMRQWLEAGYFKGDLPISQDPKGPYRTLSSLFPDIEVAFKPTDPSKSELAAEAEEARQKAEAAAAAAGESAKLEREKAEKDRAEAESRVKTEEAAAAAKVAETMRQHQEQESQSNQNQSAQLKMLLGLGGGSSSTIGGVKSDISENNNANKDQESELKPQNKASKPKETKQPNGVVKEQAQSTPVQPTAPAWGGAGTSKPAARKKSMSEIQQEEARVAARVSKQKSSNSGGWANIAASGGTTAWSGSAVLSSTPATVNNATLPQTNSSLPSRSKQQATGIAAQKQAKAQSSTQKTMEEFGANGKMTSALESWCKDQMRKLSGNDDLTLIAFCMTLSDPVEIKGYLTAYLGSTSHVNNFAIEFINRKNGTKQQEQWETTGGSKKGRKKKSTVAK